MKKETICFIICLSVHIVLYAQDKEFSIKGTISGMKDGISVSLLNIEDTSAPVLAESAVINGSFILKGKISRPTLCCLTTNNLKLIPDLDKDVDKIHWTYTDIFVTNTDYIFQAVHYDSISVSKPIGQYFRITGKGPQDDFNEYNLKALSIELLSDNIREDSLRKIQLNFISTHPKSSISIMLANNLLKGGCRMTRRDVDKLNKMIIDTPNDPLRLAEFRKNCMAARITGLNEPVLNLSLYDIKGNPCNLTSIIPKGKYVLVDFWASWCGICRAAIPDIKKLYQEYPNKFTVISVSADQNRNAWIKAINDEKMSWKQYLLTPHGFKELSEKYLTQGVPFYMIVNPQGNVVCAPQNITDLQNFFEENRN